MISSFLILRDIGVSELHTAGRVRRACHPEDFLPVTLGSHPDYHQRGEGGGLFLSSSFV